MAFEQIDQAEYLSPQIRNRIRNLEEWLESIPSEVLSPEERNMIGRALAVYIRHLRQQNKLHFLELVLRDGQPVNQKHLDEYTLLHTDRNNSLCAEVIEMFEDDTMNVVLAGPMYAAKSALAIELYRQLVKERETVSAWIFAGMQEDGIRARAYEEEIGDVQQVTLENMMEKARDLQKGQYLIIEEYSFLGFTDAQVADFRQFISELNTRGIRTILVGLDQSYRATNLPLFNTMMSFEGTHTAELGSYTHYNGTEQPLDCYTTGRSVVMPNGDGMTEVFDFLLPVVVPREVGEGVIRYFPMPAELHPLNVIQQEDPELYNELMAQDNQQLLIYLFAKRLADQLNDNYLDVRASYIDRAHPIYVETIKALLYIYENMSTEAEDAKNLLWELITHRKNDVGKIYPINDLETQLNNSSPVES